MPNPSLLSKNIFALKDDGSELQQLLSIYETALATTPDFVYVIDTDSNFLYANKALLDM